MLPDPRDRDEGMSRDLWIRKWRMAAGGVCNWIHANVADEIW